MKKSILGIVLTLCMLMGCAPIVVNAESEEIYDDLKYIAYNSYYDKYVKITGYIGEQASIAIPSQINGLPVTRIGDSAFLGCSSLTSVKIPDSVTNIGDFAFKDCINLANVTIPDSVTQIDYWAFYNCRSLTSITIPNKITRIDDGVFYSCSSLTSVIIPDSVTSIGDNAFYNCSSLTSITIPNSVSWIHRGAFECCTGLTSITIPDSITRIEDGAFEDCSSLTSITIPNSITQIEDEVFYGCSSLTSVTIPDSVISIGYLAFNNCSSLTSIIIPNSVTNIGSGAFENTAYYNNEQNWIDNVLYIGNHLIGVNYDVPENYEIKQGTLCIAGGAFYLHTDLTSVTIPDSVTSIGNAAFRGCNSLTSVTIPDSVTNIGDVAFGNCTSLTSITIPDSVTNIGDGAFCGCINLTSISIPNSVTTISHEAFSECTRLTSISIPNNVISIGYMAFYACNRLKDIYYSGSEAEWNAIEIRNNNVSLTNATIHYGSGKSYTPVEVNPPRPSSAPSQRSYGVVKSNRETTETDVRETLKKRSEEFNKAALAYTAAVSKSAKSQGGTEDDVETLAKKLESEYNENPGKRILLPAGTDANVKKVAFEGYARFLNQMIEEGQKLNKIDLSDSAVMIDYKLTREILSKIRAKNLSYEYKGYRVKINGLFNSKSNFGNLEVIAPNGDITWATMVSDPDQTMADLQDFASQLKDVAQDVNKKALHAVVSDLVNLTGLGDLGKLIARDGLKEYKPLTKLGYGDVVKNIKKCYSGYEAVKDILNCVDVKDLDSIIDNPKQLSKKLANLAGYEDSITNAAVNAAQDKLVNAIYNLMYAAYDYESVVEGEKPSFMEKVKDFFDKTTSWVSSLFQCPVDFTVYDENGEMIGYVDNGAVYYNDNIYIEVSGDVKKLYVPVGMKVDIKMTGIDEGELNYIVEEVIYNHPTGRLNYYGLPLSEGTEYTQSLDTTEFDNNTEVLPIVSSNGVVTANEYISSEDTTAYVIINTNSDNEGTVLGGGDYAKGDSVELTAVPRNSNYVFNGWYIGEELVSVDSIYRFTAIENTDVYAEFIRVYNADNAYDMQISDAIDDIYTYIYKDYDNSMGIVIVPFGEQISDSKQIYVTTYAEDGSVISSDVSYSAELNEIGVYAFENIDLRGVAKVVITGADGTEIASADYDSSKDITNIYITVSDQYSDSLEVTAREESGKVIVDFNILNDEISRNDITAYLAEYDDNDVLIDCTILEETITENGIAFEEYFNENYRLMFWNGDMCPLTEVITPYLLEI